MTINPHIGSSFEDLLKEEGIHAEVTARATKRVLAWQIAQAMQAQGVNKTQMAKRMQTSRAQIDTVQRAASVLGRTLQIELR